MAGRHIVPLRQAFKYKQQLDLAAFVPLPLAIPVIVHNYKNHDSLNDLNSASLRRAHPMPALRRTSASIEPNP